MLPTLSPQLREVAKLLDRTPPQLVVVVGTGVAKGATDQLHADWLGLLKHGIQHLVTEKRFTPEYGEELKATLAAAFSPFDLQTALQHAELVEQTLNTPTAAAFARWLDSAFSNFKAV